MLQVKGLTPEGFALNHPTGNLGRRLTLRVGDLMHSGEQVPTVGLTAPWLDVVGAISQGGLGAVAVVGEGGELAGVVQAFFPGEEGGGAIAGVLSGRLVPSGRLPVEMPASPGGQPSSYLRPRLAAQHPGS